MSHHYTHYPPMRIHSSQPVSADVALDLISNYLTAAESDASLHPNAMLTESGPSATTEAGGGGSLILHSLRRIEAALRGEHLEPPLPPHAAAENSGKEATPPLPLSTTERMGSDVVLETPPSKASGKKQRKKRVEQDEEGPENGYVEADGEWQDPEVFRQQQDVVEGEVGDRMQGVVEGAAAERNLEKAEKSMDKEARKKAKKERRSKEKKDREKARKSKEGA